ncbi:MAG TPA: M28 family peptidase [Bacteroidota bacterium]|nr:M28 family peptidase [Bacteroidota bacterium]
MKRFLPVVVLSVVGSLLLFAQSREEKKFASRVSQKNLTQTVRDLVGLGNRMGGTASGDRAARYLQQRFKSFGLAVQQLKESPKLTYTHTSWSLQVTRPRRLRGLIRNEWLAGFSPSTKPTTGRLIFYDPEIPKDSLSKKVVLTDRNVGPEFYKELVEAGVICILTYAPNIETAYSRWAMISSLPASKSHPIPVYNISRSNGEVLRNEIAKEVTVDIRFAAKTIIREGSPKTVVATLRGKSDEYYIVCAHGDSDSGGPGADDNASGEAGVLEIARILSSMVGSGELPRPQKTIKFVIWGSEYSSAEEFVKREKDSLEKILGVMNYDEIGTGAERNCIYFESNDVPHNEKLLRTLEAVGEEYVGKKGFWQEATTNPSQGGTDSYVFLPDYLERLDLPSVEIPSSTIYTAAWNAPRTLPQTKGWSARSWKGHPDSVIVDYSAYYHSSLDLPQYTTEREPFNMVWAVKAVGIALLRLAW